MTELEMKSGLQAIETGLNGFIQKNESSLNELKSRVFTMEQRMSTSSLAGGSFEGEKSLGYAVVNSGQFKSFIEGGNRSSGAIKVGSFFKTALVNATGQNQPLVPAYRVPGIIAPGTPRLTVRDLLPQLPCTSNAIEYVRELSFTNNAAPQGKGSSPLVREGIAKAESAFSFELKNAPVETLAHFLPASKQILDDAPALAAYLDTRMRFGLKVEEEGELLGGTGTDNELSGLITNATAYDTGRNVSGDTMNDTIRHAITQCDLSFFPSEFVILHPNDWEKIELIKTTGTASSGEYIGGDPSNAGIKRRWSKVVVDTPSMDEGHFLVGSSQAAAIWDRQQATVELSREHADYFVRNLVALLCEERICLTVFRPAGLIYGAFPE